MPKRSFAEKDTFLTAKKSKTTVSDKNLGYRGVNSITESMEPKETSSTAFTKATQSPSEPSRKSKRLAGMSVAKDVKLDSGVAPASPPTHGPKSSSLNALKCPKFDALNEISTPANVDDHVCNRPWSSLGIPPSGLQTARIAPSPVPSTKATPPPTLPPSTKATPPPTPAPSTKATPPPTLAPSTKATPPPTLAPSTKATPTPAPKKLTKKPQGKQSVKETKAGGKKAPTSTKATPPPTPTPSTKVTPPPTPAPKKLPKEPQGKQPVNETKADGKKASTSSKATPPPTPTPSTKVTPPPTPAPKKLPKEPQGKQPVNETKADGKKAPTSSKDNATKYNFTNLEVPTKSSKDAKEYRIVRLCNGLRVILVSDVRTDRELEQCLDDSSSSDDDDSDDASSVASRSMADSDSEPEKEDKMPADNSNYEGLERDVKPHHRPMEEKLAAVGLTVGVGSFSDPEDIPGLAHFLEHMVFMGSAKYPKENDFDSFIRRHGGSDNAHTAFETTTFYFECQDKHLLKGMDKFSQFFQHPLLNKDAITREREAVESEFQESKMSDGDRVVQLLAGIARQDHPASKFTWGNSVTLQQNVDKLHAALHAFRSRHYSAHRMTLAVEARLPMEELESLVASTFSAIPNNSLPPDDFTPYAGSFDTPEFNRVYRVASIKDRMEVVLTWAFPSFLRDYKNKPYEYLESLLDHEGRGSLLAHLRDKLWALEIASGEAESGFEDTSMFFLFSITILLTEEGYKHVDEVIAAVFGYIAMLRADAPSRRYFDELQSMAESNFMYADEIPPGDYVEQLSEAMQYYQPADVLAARYLLYNYDAQAIKDFQDGMTPDRVNVIISSKDATVAYDREEKWFETKYCVSDIPVQWLESWRGATPRPCFHIPEPNIYIPTDLSILPPDKDELVEEYPFIIGATKLCEIWYKRDNKFNLPVAYYMLNLVSPLPSSSPFNSVLLDIYSAMLEYTLAADLYAARLGSISYVITPSDNGIKIRVGGFNEKLPLVMETIAQHMASFKDNFSEDMFNTVKEERTKMYYNRFIKPVGLNSELRLQLLMSRYWTCVDKHSAVFGVTKQMLLDFVYDYHSSFYIQALVQGNVTRQQALQACHKITSVLDTREIPDQQYPEFRVSKIDEGSRLLRVASFNRDDSNSAITNYYQFGLGTIRNCCIQELVLSLMEEPLFDTLRTKEQLGYSVDCAMKDTYGVIGYTITINYQEDKFSIDHVDERIEAFLETFSKAFGKMKAKKLDDARKTLIKLKLCSDVHLKEECSRHWGEILSKTYLFDRPRKEVECLNTITFKEVRAWVSEQLALKSHVRKLSIQVVGNPSPKKTLPEAPRKSTSKHKLNVFNPPHPVLDTRLSDVELPTLPTLPGPKFALDVLTPDDRPERAITNVDRYRQTLSVHPVHCILE